GAASMRKTASTLASESVTAMVARNPVALASPAAWVTTRRTSSGVRVGRPPWARPAAAGPPAEPPHAERSNPSPQVAIGPGPIEGTWWRMAILLEALWVEAGTLD